LEVIAKAGVEVDYEQIIKNQMAKFEERTRTEQEKQ
jgi:hypothetical protein